MTRDTGMMRAVGTVVHVGRATATGEGPDPVLRYRQKGHVSPTVDENYVLSLTFPSDRPMGL
jgi:hypothetical protein